MQNSSACLHAVVRHLLARVAGASVEETRHVKLDGRIGLHQVAQLRATTDRAREAEDALVLAEHVGRADASETALGVWLDAALLVVHVLQPWRRERDLGHLAVLVQHDHLPKRGVARGEIDKAEYLTAGAP